MKGNLKDNIGEGLIDRLPLHHLELEVEGD
jgi:hypothetical protein